ncbi:[protein-PII] uridylyltransferase [Crossiella sp. CA-258035]|uniref:[protein-PII] uridylyltransferase n=1 Tax=Crossiella sp. CA-258035 TaxID=2981138 RepID=UPI0024BC707E|nr:[protein-PII] uridylyltransferase [Crossiella sp. CA-258035]WHT18061.1 [protein-PII] uridylyltransferase [Crossiella sp. CA-258035]
MSAGISESVGPAAGDLVRARQLLLAPAPGHRKLAAEPLRAALVDLHDFWLAAHAGLAGIGGAGSGTALVAVGALGRRELAPYSDLDLVLVHNGRTEVGALADRLWYPLWNSGIGLDHSVRTTAEAEKVAGADLRAALGLLEVRHLVGDQSLSDRLAAGARQSWRAGIRNRFEELVEAAETRWQRSGEVAHRVEPDLKNGKGGLRDLNLLDALAATQLVDRPGKEVREARTLLLDVRTELHRACGKARDIIRAEDGDEIALALGLPDRFELARLLSATGRTVAYAVDVALRTARNALPRKGFAALSSRAPWNRGPARRPLDDGVVLHGGEVALARDAVPARDPGLLLRVAASAARTGSPIAAGTLARLADSAPELRRPWPSEARQELLALLGCGRGLIGVVEALDRTGLWGRLFPEWGAVRDLPPRDAAHAWTVDRHLVHAVANAARLATTVSRPDLLLLATLLHDIGKGRDGDHSEVGAALATQVCERLGLWPSDVAVVASVVRHHLLLPHTATRRDVEDPATVHRVVDTLGGDPVVLELLHALAEADSLATGPGVWTEWKAALIADLARRCRAAMAGEQLAGPGPLPAEQAELAESAVATGKPHVVITPSGHTATVTVLAPDRIGLLSLASGVLALNSLEVHAAEVSAHAGAGVETFTVSPRFGTLPDAALLREQLVKVLDGTLSLADRLAAKERDYGGPPEEIAPPRVLWFDDEASGAVVMELRATDRIGLLHRVAAALEACKVDVRWARVATLGGTVVDSFSITTSDNGLAEPGSPARRKIEKAVLAAAR